MIAIIGAGLTGLSTAYHLSDLPYSVFDSEKEVGGLCRSVRQNGFVFDYTGHLLHMKDPYTKNFIETILPNTFMEKSRKAAVFLKDRYLPYPFQANLHGLPKKVIFECIFDLIKKKTRSKNKDDLNFKEWVFETFGEGISKQFFIPYNEKLFRTGLENLTRNWASWSIPCPSLTEVIRGAIGIKNIKMGYNASFYYPAKTGIDVLPKELEKRVRNIQLNKKLVSVDISNKCIEFNDGTKQNYNYLVSTLPLPRLLEKIEGLPDSFKDISKNLNHVSVQNLNIGISRKKITDFHWIYFPEGKYPFYRVGCYSNISNALAPKNTSSLYIEISSRPEKKRSIEQITAETIEGLKMCGILKKTDSIIEKKYIEIEHGYVIFDKFREKILPDIFSYLEKNNIFSIGRYGSWTYSAMEDSILKGKEIAETLRCRE